ncbi:MAG: hypothetical protein AAFP97_03995 [Pseudomonadota bacterium]
MQRFRSTGLSLVAGSAMLLSLAVSTSANAQSTQVVTSQPVTQSRTVRALTIQNARLEASDVVGTNITSPLAGTNRTGQFPRVDDHFQVYGNRAQRKRMAQRKAEKCARALEKLASLETSENGASHPVPFACR